MGAAGDMLSAALIELVDDRQEFLNRLNSLGIPGVEYVLKPCTKNGITGSQMVVSVGGVVEGEEVHEHHHHDHDHEHEHEDGHGHHHHHHTSMKDIERIVGNLAVEESVKKDILSVYTLIAQAESHAHGMPVEEIHFHEVGTMDAVADISAVCLLVDELKPERIVSSPIHVGSGHVECAHGILPVPAPATAYILRDVPIYGGGIKGELCTPTGAALLRHFVTDFNDMPAMRVQKIGYGMGKRDYLAINAVRAMIGETDEKRNEVVELRMNIDDMTSEETSFALEEVLSAGALDAIQIPAMMKKSRMGSVLEILCRLEDERKIVDILFRHTSTLGIRRRTVERYELERTTAEVTFDSETARLKISSGHGVQKRKYEYEDIARIAREGNMTIRSVIGKLDGKEC